MSNIGQTAAKSILVVEDSVDLRMLFEHILSSEGFATTVACDGIEALEVLRSGVHVDLILMDLSMPRMNGAEFIRTMRAFPGRSQTKVVVVSGWDDLKVRAAELGACGFIKKPIDLDLFCREIAMHVGT